ncbi:putative O-methyltransferase YrrM [Paenibacillus prosopidis]|uniref:Putative O-methyltransferase YrrM n=2 Tax=Paenibacillus prosopidis TaxID=630520 RepID=A0A368W5Q7_9BACL|nr:putative O-methyltransferase YrrM [Paenibacillus prosopidis]
MFMLQESMNQPWLADHIQRKAKEHNFTMSCDNLTGSLLRLLISTKPNCKALELGTGAGYSTTWLLDGMDHDSLLITVESEEKYINIAKEVILDRRVDFRVTDGVDFIKEHLDQKFDLIFADTWPGKFYLLDEVLGMLKPNGLYIIDDLNPQPNWPEGHGDKVHKLIEALDQKEDFHILKLDWSTGIMILTKK